MLEPGLDKHEWISVWQQLEEDIETDAAQALPEVDRLIEQMLQARGYAIDDEEYDDGEDGQDPGRED